MFFFSEKLSFSELQIFMGFMVIYKLYEKQLTPGRYPAPHFVQTKKTASKCPNQAHDMTQEHRARECIQQPHRDQMSTII